jgi:serine/threonine protein kinase
LWIPELCWFISFFFPFSFFFGCFACDVLSNLAPEVISGKLYAGPCVDVWSCGVILYAFLCACLPFDDKSLEILFQKIKSGVYNLPSALPPDVRDLISKILVVDPVKRITIPEIRKHPWFLKSLPVYLQISPDEENLHRPKVFFYFFYFVFFIIFILGY